MLDFTENPLVALYFACCEANEEDACVWIVNNPEYFRWLQGIPTVVLESTSRAVVDDVIRTQMLDNIRIRQITDAFNLLGFINHIIGKNA